MPSFQDFSLQAATRAVLTRMEITEPTPIQAEAIPALLAGKDLVGQSATGSGKTLAYSIPMIERLAKDKRVVQALVMVPTRELALQVNTVINQFTANRRLTTALLVGGKPYGNQISALRYGAQIVVGTPGRIKDHLERGTLVMDHLRICVLDEADQMLDIGFAPVIEDILSNTPETRQMALFSATMPDWVAKLQEKFLKDPIKVSITPEVGGESTIEQIAYQVPQDQKMAALCTLLHEAEGESSIIFGKTKYGVEKLGKQLSGLGYTVATLHGNKSQNARDKVLASFRRGHVQTLLATNVAARGLDIQGIHQVINYELPESSELFTHRIGRTGRMGRQGKAITLLVPSDVPKWRRMSRSLGQAVSIKKLVINEEAMVSRPRVVAAPVVEEREPVYREPEHREQPLPLRGRRGQERERGSYSRARQEYGDRGRQQRERFPREIERERFPREIERQPERFAQPEENYYREERGRSGRRAGAYGRIEERGRPGRFVQPEERERPGRFAQPEERRFERGSERSGRRESEWQPSYEERTREWLSDEPFQRDESAFRERDNSRALRTYHKTPKKQKNAAIVTKEGQAQQGGRVKSRPAPSIRARRAATSNRSKSR